jgi:hypothetical protein
VFRAPEDSLDSDTSPAGDVPSLATSTGGVGASTTATLSNPSVMTVHKQTELALHHLIAFHRPMAQSIRVAVSSQLSSFEYILVDAFHNYPAGQPNTDRRLLHISGEHPHLHISHAQAYAASREQLCAISSKSPFRRNSRICIPTSSTCSDLNPECSSLLFDLADSSDVKSESLVARYVVPR